MAGVQVHQHVVHQGVAAVPLTHIREHLTLSNVAALVVDHVVHATTAVQVHHDRVVELDAGFWRCHDARVDGHRVVAEVSVDTDAPGLVLVDV